MFRWNSHVVLGQDGHAHTEHHDYRVEVSVCETSEQGLLSFASSFGVDQNAKDVFDTMLFKSKQEGQVSLDRHVHLLAYRSCCQDNKIHCCGLLTQSCGDQGGRECASFLASARGVQCLGIASSDTVGKWFSFGISRFQIRFVLTHKISSPRPVHFASR